MNEDTEDTNGQDKSFLKERRKNRRKKDFSSEEDLAPGASFTDSIRERLKNRIAQARKSLESPTETVLRNEHSNHSRILSGRRSLDTISRFENSYDFDKHGRMSAVEEINEINDYDFFTSTTLVNEASTKDNTLQGIASSLGNLDLVTKEEEIEQGEKQGENPKEPAEEAQEDVAGSRDLEEDKKEFYNIEICKLSYTPHQERIDLEKEIYYTVDGKPVALWNAQDLENAPHLGDDGYFVGIEPLQSVGNYNRACQRLLHNPDQGLGWFSPSGYKTSLPDPLKPFPSKPSLWDDSEVDHNLDAKYEKGTLEEYDPKLIRFTGDQTGQTRKYQLDIDISRLQFTDHYLFTKEQALSQELENLFNQYILTNRMDMVTYLTQKLRSLKSGIITIQEKIKSLEESKSSSDSSKTPLVSTSRLRNAIASIQEKNRNVEVKSLPVNEYRKILAEYRQELREVRQLRDEEEYIEIRIVKNMIDVWNEIKKLRQKQGYQITTVKLVIHKQEVYDTQEDKRVFLREINDELEELRFDHSTLVQKEFNQRLAEYEYERKKMKRENKATGEASKILSKLNKRRVRKQESEGAPLGQLLYEDDEPNESPDTSIAGVEKTPEEILYETKLDLPFHKDELLNGISEKAYKRKRNPGQPFLIPELVDCQQVTSEYSLPEYEIQRRGNINQERYYLKILFNGKEVSKTGARPLGHDFTVSIGEIFNLQIIEWPENVTIQLWMVSSPRDTLLADIYVAIPDYTVSSSNAQREELQFSTGQQINGYFDDHVVNPTHLVNTVRYVSGVLIVSAGWGQADDGSPLAPSSNQIFALQRGKGAKGSALGLDPLAAIGVKGNINIQKLRTWILDSRIDPNNPRNAAILEMMRILEAQKGQGNTDEENNSFRLNYQEYDCNFVFERPIESSKRFKLLHLRALNEPNYRKMKMVPTVEYEIDPLTLGNTQDKVAQLEDNESKFKKKEVGKRMTEMSTFLRNLKEKQLLKFSNTKKLVSLQDVVIEQPVPTIQLAFDSLIELMSVKRPLKPKRRERTRLHAYNPDSCKLIVTINRAFNVPIRTPNTTSTLESTLKGFSGANGEEKTGSQISQNGFVRPFVEIMFQRKSERTRVFEGNNPQWNEIMSLDFSPANGDFSPANLMAVSDEVYFTLFDEIEVDALEDDRQKETHEHIRYEKRYLGSFKIPFSTVYLNTKVEGKFKMTSPLYMFGYEYDKSNFLSGQNENTDTFLSTYITLEPPLQHPSQMRDRFESIEREDLLSYGKTWEKRLLRKHYLKDRTIQFTGQDINGKLVFLTRYIKSQKPPTQCRGVREIVKFVSMIPFVDDAVAFSGDSTCDLWTTSDQFLELGAGDEEEHAILLCNYFLYFKKNAWVVLGKGIPEGNTAYVLTYESSYRLWNPSKGISYETSDPDCPLMEVGTVFNETNVWVNTQLSAKPSRMDFNVSNTRNWAPFFTKNFPHRSLSSVQIDHLIYRQTSPGYVAEVQHYIEDVLSQSIENWRERFVTRWNRICNRNLRLLLESFENSANASATMQVDQNTILHDIVQTYDLNGFPINFPFTDIDPIVEAVFNTGVHIKEDENCEFSLAVHIHPYPNDILSVWVYVAALTRKVKRTTDHVTN
eukprot:Nk52_evm28s78 gene=Nk52_evmTU28s78